MVYVMLMNGAEGSVDSAEWSDVPTSVSAERGRTFVGVKLRAGGKEMYPQIPKVFLTYHSDTKSLLTG